MLRCSITILPDLPSARLCLGGHPNRTTLAFGGPPRCFELEEEEEEYRKNIEQTMLYGIVLTGSLD